MRTRRIRKLAEAIGYGVKMTALTLAASALLAGGLKLAFDIAAEDNRDNENELSMDEERLQLALDADSFCITDDCLEDIKDIEKYMPVAYEDAAGHLTIGYGHRIKKDEEFPAWLSPKAAENLLREDVSYFENIVRAEVTAPITQHHFDALVSLTYNIGERNFRSSDLLGYLNDGYYDRAGEEFDRWNKVSEYEELADGTFRRYLVVSNGLTIRRAEERGVFDTGTMLLKSSNNAALDDERPEILQPTPRI